MPQASPAFTLDQRSMQPFYQKKSAEQHRHKRQCKPIEILLNHKPNLPALPPDQPRHKEETRFGKTQAKERPLPMRRVRKMNNPVIKPTMQMPPSDRCAARFPLFAARPAIHCLAITHSFLLFITFKSFFKKLQ